MQHPVRSKAFSSLAVAAILLLAGQAAAADGDPEKGVRTFRNLCTPCHSLQPGRSMSGPSLSGIVGRKAGSVDSFARYSKALPQSPVVWDAATLDAWLANPTAVIPGNSMTMLVADAQARADIIAYLVAAQPAGGGGRSDLPRVPEGTIDLKSAGPGTTVAAIAYCRDTYTLTMANGSALQFWESNLRFKTDSSPDGPAAQKPVLVPGGQQGDRSFLVFATPGEISGSVKPGC